MFTTTQGQEAELPERFSGPYSSYWRTVDVYPALTWFIATYRIASETRNDLGGYVTRLFDSEPEVIQHIRSRRDEQPRCILRVATSDGGATWRMQEIAELWLPGDQLSPSILLHAMQGDSALYDETDVVIDRKTLKEDQLLWRE